MKPRNRRPGATVSLTAMSQPTQPWRDRPTRTPLRRAAPTFSTLPTKRGDSGESLVASSAGSAVRWPHSGRGAKRRLCLCLRRATRGAAKRRLCRAKRGGAKRGAKRGGAKRGGAKHVLRSAVPRSAVARITVALPPPWPEARSPPAPPTNRLVPPPFSVRIPPLCATGSPSSASSRRRASSLRRAPLAVLRRRLPARPSVFPRRLRQRPPPHLHRPLLVQPVR